jgi:hypothetical protein
VTVFTQLTTINIPQPPGPNVDISATGVDAAGEVVGSYVIARSEATKQSRTAVPHWIASLRSQ